VYKIFIAENVPSLNKGEMAILKGIFESVKKLGKVEFTMLSGHPDIDKSRYKNEINIIDTGKHFSFCYKNYITKLIPSLIVFLKHLLFLILYKIFGSNAIKFMKSELWKVYLNSDAIFMGHNGTYGIGGGFGNPIFFYHYYLPLFANILSIPIVLYGGSINKPRIFPFLLNRLSTFALKRINLVTLRERISFFRLKALGVQKNKIYVTSDLAFLLKPASIERIEKIMKMECIDDSYKPLIGVTVSHKIANKSFLEHGHSISYIKHNEEFAKIIDILTDKNKHNAYVIFIPHCIGQDKLLDDRIIATDIYKLCKNKGKIKIITNEYSPEELKGLIGKFNFFLGERLHSVINAMSMFVPSIALSYSSDTRLDIIKMIGQKKAIYYVEELNAYSLLEKINKMLLQKEKIIKELKLQIQITKEKSLLNGKLIKKMLNSLSIKNR